MSRFNRHNPEAPVNHDWFAGGRRVTEERKPMKAFWDNYFFDMEECNLTKEEMAEKAGKEIRDDLQRIENAIRDYDLKEALRLIDELKEAY